MLANLRVLFVAGPCYVLLAAAALELSVLALLARYAAIDIVADRAHGEIDRATLRQPAAIFRRETLSTTRVHAVPADGHADGALLSTADGRVTRAGRIPAVDVQLSNADGRVAPAWLVIALDLQLSTADGRVAPAWLVEALTQGSAQFFFLLGSAVVKCDAVATAGLPRRKHTISLAR